VLWNWDKIKFQEPWIQPDYLNQRQSCVEQNLLNLESLLPKWQLTSDAVMRLNHLGFFSSKVFLMNLLNNTFKPFRFFQFKGFSNELTQIRTAMLLYKKVPATLSRLFGQLVSSLLSPNGHEPLNLRCRKAKKIY
jgi:hypothetical protein